MLLLYNIGIRLYFVFIYFASPFNKKARLWIDGRKNTSFVRCEGSFWFHFASLGEFEQGRSVLERLRELHPETKIIITFFSPSGYEVRKNTPLADAVYYLPLDTAFNARKFMDAIKPEMVVFTKYEYWYHFFKEVHKRGIPLYVISSIFRPEQVFFKWYGGFNRRMLGFVNRFFVQDETSKQLLSEIGLHNVTISGDTRFDRVWANAQNPKSIDIAAQFKSGEKVFIAGSTWPPDEQLVAVLASQYPDWKFIIAPHEINEEKIESLIKLLPEGSALRYSQIREGDGLAKSQTLVIDNVGILSSLYQYGNIAYIGGGFGVGIHNTLEAAAFGLPVIFGPEYSRFKEAKDLVGLQAGFSIGSEYELKAAAGKLINDNEFYTAACATAKNYVEKHTGATDAIIQYIEIKNAGQ